ncbi:hypothetical protein B296_00051365 [Ensete ventricosum]|uniref:Uncharacterized protein n=1 Tax=Ensete ventricosum TaxID=4639 RepID=A0A426XXN0_ENSVE|nr:hypothetical protein B296_00051365 [Ensete ventricosum]
MSHVPLSLWTLLLRYNVMYSSNKSAMQNLQINYDERKLHSEVSLKLSPGIEPELGRCCWELAWSASGVGRGYRKLAGGSSEASQRRSGGCKMMQGSSPEEDQETHRKIVEGSRKVCREYKMELEKWGVSFSRIPGDYTAGALFSELLSAVAPLAPALGYHPYPAFPGAFEILAPNSKANWGL